ncbi:MAG: class I SAM-dependent methyltransferase [Opitutaceae bacterium]|jgi:GT2 family glycosyltransferase/glycosyltransferase involved in cell wall biosynthesis
MQAILTALSFKPTYLNDPPAWIGHIPLAATLVKELRPQVLVELGTHYGNSYFAFCQSVSENQLSTQCYAVDTWQGEMHAGLYDESVYRLVSDYNQKHYRHFSKLIRATFDEAAAQFPDNSIDILHIDGLHTYEAVKHDYETWLPKVRSGGVILFHDVCANHDDFGVWRLWEEIQTQTPHTITFQHSHGLGVLFNGQLTPKQGFLRQLLNKTETQAWQHIFMQTGEQILALYKQQITHAQVFVLYDGLFQEEKSEYATYNWGQNTIIRFKALGRFASEGPILLRIDPTDRIAHLNIRRISLYSEDNTIQPAKEFKLTDDTMKGIALLPTEGSYADSVALNNDPQLHLPPFTWKGPCPWFLEIELTATNAPEALMPLVEKQAKKLQSLDQQITQQTTAFTLLQQQLTDKQHEQENQISSFQRHIGILENTNHHLKLMQSQLRMDARKHQEIILYQNQELEKLKGKHALLFQQLHVIHESLWWRVATPLRILERLIRTPPVCVGQNCRYEIEHGIGTHRFSRLREPLRVSGWFMDSEGRPADSIQIDFGTQTFGCTPTMRNDVTDHFEHEGLHLDNSKLGFETSIIPPGGIHDVRINAICHNGSVVCLQRGRRWSFSQGKFKLEMPVTSVVTKVSREVHVQGWFFDALGLPAREVRILIGQRTLACEPVDRPDVVNAFQGILPVMAATGFSLHFRVGLGMKRIKVIAITQDGRQVTIGSRFIWTGSLVPPPQRTPSARILLEALRLLSVKPPQIETFPPTAPVAVILPIYRDVAMTRECIVRAMIDIDGKPGRRLVAINDASPETAMIEMLTELQNRWPSCIQVIHNDTNLGFVCTVNRGLKLIRAGEDVILLNSDVFTPENWINRLQTEVYSSPRCGIVTPLSNNATICSFPAAFTENKAFLGLSEQKIDRHFARVRYPNVEAPTGVGFCMFIRCDCLAAVGFLDEQRFGRGYGEENDFCQRAIRLGWKNMLTPNLYALHLGSVSFGAEKTSRIENALRQLSELYPSYHEDIARYTREDPLRAARFARGAAIIAAQECPVILAISHRLGGGTHQHIEELAQHLTGHAHFLDLRPGPREGWLELRLTVDSAEPVLLDAHEDWDHLLRFLRFVGVGLVHIHHTLGLPAHVHRLAIELGVPHVATVHDFFWLGANPTLTDPHGVYAGDSLRAPLGSPNYRPPRGTTLRSWRESHRELLEQATDIIFPSRSARELFENAYSPRSVRIIPHIEDARLTLAPVRHQRGPILTIGVLGALSLEKGALLLEELATLVHDADMPYRFVLIGYASRPLAHVHITGRYKPGELAHLIAQHNLNIILFPARWPETYSYTLSYALASGLPIIAPALGAFPERLAASGIPHMLFRKEETTHQILAHIEKFATNVEAQTPITFNPLKTTDYYRSDYLSHCVSQKPRNA